MNCKRADISEVSNNDYMEDRVMSPRLGTCGNMRFSDMLKMETHRTDLGLLFPLLGGLDRE